MFYLRRGWSGGHSQFFSISRKFSKKDKIFGPLFNFLTTPPKIPQNTPHPPLPPPPKTPGVTFFCGKGDRFHSKWPDFHDFGAFDKEGGIWPIPQKGSKTMKFGPISGNAHPTPLLRLNIVLFLLHIYLFYLDQSDISLVRKLL